MYLFFLLVAMPPDTGLNKAISLHSTVITNGYLIK
jgi:hypothetical protein